MFRVTRHWDPWREFDQLRHEMNRLFSRYRPEPDVDRSEFPAINVWRSEDGLALTAELPGLDSDHIDVTVTADAVTISGERPAEPLKEGQAYHLRERLTEPFSRTVTLPFEVDPQQAEAGYEKGVLTLKLRRPEEQKSKKVVVKPA